MSDQWNEFVRATAESFAVNEQTVSTVLLFAALLAVFAVGVAVHVYYAAGNRKLSLRGLFSALVSCVWAVPVVAVVAVFAARAAGTIGAPTPVPGIDAPLDIAVSEALPDDLSADAPVWVQKRQIAGGGGRKKIVLSTGFEPVRKEAEQALLAETYRRVQSEFVRDDPLGGYGQISPETVEAHAVLRKYVEEKTKTFRLTSKSNDGQTETHTFPVYRVHWEIELSPEARSAFRPGLLAPRLWLAGGALALLTLILAATAAYLRFDAYSQGKYRFRLKAATVSLIVAGGLLLTAAWPLA